MHFLDHIHLCGSETLKCDHALLISGLGQGAGLDRDAFSLDRQQVFLPLFHWVAGLHEHRCLCPNRSIRISLVLRLEPRDAQGGRDPQPGAQEPDWDLCRLMTAVIDEEFGRTARNYWYQDTDPHPALLLLPVQELVLICPIDLNTAHR